jgi:hypothetical protein
MFCLPQLLSRNVDIYVIQILNGIEKGDEFRLHTEKVNLGLMN